MGVRSSQRLMIKSESVFFRAAAHRHVVSLSFFKHFSPVHYPNEAGRERLLMVYDLIALVLIMRGDSSAPRLVISRESEKQNEVQKVDEKEGKQNQNMIYSKATAIGDNNNAFALHSVMRDGYKWG